MIGPPIHDWHETLRFAGTVINVFPSNTFVIRGTRARAEALRGADGFQHIEPYQPGFKIQTRLAGAPDKVRAIIQLDAGQNLEEALTVIEGMVDRQFSRETSGPFKNLLVELTPEQALQLAQRPEVIWLEPYTKPGFSDERHAMVVASQHDGNRPDDPLDGDTTRYQDWLENKGFCGDPPIPGCISYSTKVAVVDSGLDWNVCKTYFSFPQNNGDLEDTYDPVSGICDWAEIPPPPDPVPHRSHHSDLVGRENHFFCLEKDVSGVYVDQCFEETFPYHHELYEFSDFPMGDNLGHGTAVASIIGGDPIHGTQDTDSEGYFEGTGIAPSSEIVLAKIKNWEFSPDEYERLISRAFSIGTRFANNSWNEYADWGGGSDPYWPDLYHVVEYNTFSQQADSLVRDGDGGFDDHENGMTIVFSAGNYKWVEPAVNPDPNPHYLTIAPGNAKNIISVGSSSGWEEPGDSRNCCDQPFSPGEDDCNAGDDISDVLNSSTRGTSEYGGRFKPDIVAPGTRLRAAEMSDLSGPGADYWCFGGTSGAAPLVTGAAVLIDAWFHHHNDPRHPSPALIKAMLVAHAADLGGESGIDRYTEASLAHSPSHPQGWGRLELDALFSPGVEVDWFDEDHEAGAHPDSRRFAGLTTKWIQDFEVDDPNTDVIIVMAFTDAPGTPGGEDAWVNNLNLTVIDKDLSKNVGPPRYYGNKFLSGSRYSKRYLGDFPPLLSPINNVEVVRVPGTDFVNGDFSIRVNAAVLAGRAVPGLDLFHNANQDFALYVVNATAVGGSGGGTEP